MRAFVLAAGLGTRLLPFTRLLPKPLFPIAGEPILSLILRRLVEEGFNPIGVNVHYLPEKIESFLKDFSSRNPQVDLKIYHEPEILGPVGALRGARDFFKEPTLVVNADILTNLSYRVAYQAHQILGGLATMILIKGQGPGTVKISEERLLGFGKGGSGYTYTGLQVVSPDLVKLLSEEDRDLVPTYHKFLEKKFKITVQVMSGIYWRDIGTLESYLAAHEDLLLGKASLPGLSIKGPFVYPEKVPPGLVLEDWVYLAEETQVLPGTRLRQVVSWPKAKIPPGFHEKRLFV